MGRNEKMGRKIKFNFSCKSIRIALLEPRVMHLYKC